MSNRLRILKNDVLRAGLSMLHRSGAHALMAPYAQGLGLIFMLHHVRPDANPAFAPNRILEVTPEFLAAVIAQVRDAGLEIVSLDQARARIEAGDSGKRFACFTLDDGYRDNLDHAYPVFKAHNVPFTIYVPADFPIGKAELWWRALEVVIAGADHIEVMREGAVEVFETAATEEKWAAYNDLYWWLRGLEEDAQRRFMRALCARYGVDMGALASKALMSWDEIRLIAGDPLVTIGAHTVGHYALAKLDAARAHRELAEGADRLARQLGRRPRHLSYPYGDMASAGPREFEMARALGFETAVTTRKGVIFKEHKDHLTALPRVSLNGEFQSLKFTELFLSGAPFALWNRFRKLDVA